jgi:diguanylate cyclase (GGDEF)-like protein/PAS domain S-box-containing protein
MQGISHLTSSELAALGYTNLSLISETKSFHIYRALAQNKQSVLVKAPASAKPLAQHVQQLEHELEVASKLHPKYIVRPIKIERSANLTALILEGCAYSPLTGLLQPPVDLTTFFPIATGIAAALSQVHRYGLVHKEIKPENIFATTAGQVKLSGFGVASKLTCEQQSPAVPEFMLGSLAYMAPEQMGRMNRTVDFRSDLYALGVTFYQMMTGQLPFTATDPMKWLHCHVTLQPKPPREHLKTIPEPLSDIVMKLLTKNAEERYQTTEDLKADLEHCFDEWRKHGHITPFPLEARDIPRRLPIPEKLYGREREMETLLAAFNRVVAGGKPELALISGYTGVGKSAVVTELHKALVAPRGLFASGKFDQYKRGIPYATFAQAFKMLIHPLLGKSEADLEGWRRALQEALEPNGQLIVNLVPELKFIIGEQPPVPELEPQQLKARFQLVFRRFIGVFARPEHPLVLFIDDMQWLDTATLDLIENLLIQEDVQHLFLIGAYRDNEVGPDHPLTRKLVTICKAEAPATEIKLAPLTPADLTQMVMDSLHCELDRAVPLTELVQTKTAGNPFFTIQLLKTLTQKGLVYFDHDEGRWSWDLHRIQAKEHPDNIASLMAAKLTALPNNAQRALQQLACLGTTAQTQTLSLVLEAPEEEVATALQEAVDQEFIQRCGDTYSFVHDRVHEAAYELIAEASQTEIHLRIGKLLLAYTPDEKREETIFDIVSQLNRSVELVVSQGEREELAWLNLLAGQRAKQSAAYAAALTYLTAAASLLAEGYWEKQHELVFTLEINRAECEFLNGALEASELRLATLLIHSRGPLEQARIASLRIDLYMALGQMDRAITVGLSYLRHLGIDWSTHPTKEAAQREYDRIWSILGNRVIEDLIDLPLMSDPALLATMDILIKLRSPALLTDENLISMLICKAVSLSLEHGNTDGSCIAYASLGIVAGSRSGNYEMALRFGKLGYELVEQRGLTRFQARTYTNFGMFVMPWTKHVRIGRDLLHRAFDVSSKSGDIIHGAYACNSVVANLLMEGAPLIEVEHAARNGLVYAQKVRFSLVVDIITSQLGLIRSLRGLTRQFGSFVDDQFDEQRFEKHFSDEPGLVTAACFHWIRKLQARFLAGDFTAAIEASEKAEALLWSVRPFIEVTEFHFYAALSHAACCDSPTDSRYQQHVEAIATQLRQLETWAKICPENFENRAVLVSAEIARIEDRSLDAMGLYEKAIQSTRTNSFLHNEALAHELAGQFYLGLGLEATGLGHLKQARDGYLFWGAEGKKQQLERLYPQLLKQQTPLAAVDMSLASPQLDVATVTMASQALSSEIELPKLVTTLMTIALENAGSDRGLLILPRGEYFEVEVEAKASVTGVEVELIHSSIDATACPETIVNSVIRTRKSVILDDASRPEAFFEDRYLQQGQARSLICLPLLRQGRLAGVLYLENSQAAGAITAERSTLLDVLAAQAAISLENARLYDDLKKSETKYLRMLETANEGIWIQNEDNRTTFANKHMAEMLGYLAAELLGREVTEFMFEEDMAEHARKMEERSKNISDVYERRLRHKDGTPVWMLISASPIFEAERFHGSFAMLTDISERKEAEQQLTTNEQLFRTLVENSPDFFARYDLDLRRVYINPALQKLFSSSMQQVLGKLPIINSPLIEPKRYMACIRQVIDTATECSDELSYRAPDGETRWVNIRFAPEFSTDGKLLSVLAISRDITTQKAAEQERETNLRFFESLDRINRVFQSEGDIEQIMNRALDEVLNIFECDRASLIYPCDPNASSWSVPIERTKPEYPSVNQQGSQSINNDISWFMRTLLATDHPVQLGPGGNFPIPERLMEQFSIRASMAMTLRPRVDKPWQFGIQQCSHERIWTDQEMRLFEEIGHRLSDALNSLLIACNQRESEERFRLVFENSPVPIWEEDFSAIKAQLDSLKKTYGGDLENYLVQHPQIVKECAALIRVLNINEAVLELHEADSKEDLINCFTQTFVPESYDALRNELVALARGQNELLFDSAVQTLTGKRREVSVYFSVCPGYEQSLTKVFISLVNITARKQAEERLRLAASVFATSQEGILISDADNRIIDANPAFTRLTGYSRDEALGQNPGFLSAGHQNHEFYAEMWQTITTKGEWQGELWNRRKSGDVYPELLSIVAVRDEQGRLQHYVGAFSDISMLKQHEADLDRIAHYDMLTSVPNRRLLGDRLEQAIAHTRRHGKNLAVCYLDLDGFKPINDQFGHEAGDRMLIETARRLVAMSRGEDTVARLGGDEFVLLWNDIGTEADCIRALERILRKVAEPMIMKGQPVSVSASIGVTLYPNDNVDADSLLRHADHAMYTAKQLGKNCYQIFDAYLERQISAQAELLSRVARGLDKGQFELHYQPKVDYTAGHVVGVEALLRWNDPLLGLVGPKEFLTLIENDSLAFHMGRWVLEQTVCQAKIWNDMGLTLPISVNIFPHHLKYRTFINDLRNTIESHWPQMPKNRLLMEIVESTDLEELEPIEQVIKECVEMGIGFSLDDFGTGYSSLVYLRRLSIEELKIDQSFVRDMLENLDDEAIVVGVISLGKAFGLRVVAEGVETAQQAQHLVNLGCSIVQGYGFGRPMPAQAFQKWYANLMADELKVYHS